MIAIYVTMEGYAFKPQTQIWIMFEPRDATEFRWKLYCELLKNWRIQGTNSDFQIFEM